MLGTAENLVTTHVERLRTLVGRPLRSIHLLHGPAGWSPDAPVVLAAGDDRLEVCAWQLDVSVTWNRIDLTEPAFPTTERHEWRQEDRAPVGAEIVGIDVAENSYSVRRRGTEEVVAGWLLSGLRVRTTGGDLTVYNALDQNGLATDELEGMRYRPLS